MAATGCLAAAFGVRCNGVRWQRQRRREAESSAPSGGGKTVTIYSSLPLQGASRASTAGLVDGEKLALEQAGGKAGDITSSTCRSTTRPPGGQWTPEATSANARKAAQDKSTAVYIGEFNSGASAVSIPILNEAGVPQISRPTRTWV